MSHHHLAEMCWSALLLPYSWLPLDKAGGELAKYQPGEERERRVMVPTMEQGNKCNDV